MSGSHPLADQRCADLAMDEGYPIAFRRYVEAVSEAVQQFRKDWEHATPARDEFDRLLGQFVLREPVDPVVEAMEELGWGNPELHAVELRTELAKRGLHITEIGESTDANG